MIIDYNDSIDYWELLPISITYGGMQGHLRIKKICAGKKERWSVRYVRKIMKTDYRNIEHIEKYKTVFLSNKKELRVACYDMHKKLLKNGCI